MRIIHYILFLFTLILSFALGIFFFLMQSNWINFDAFELYNYAKPSILLDDQGNEWGRFMLDRRHPIPYEKIPSHVIQAFIAAEDHNFFSHTGISFKGIIRSLIVNLYNGRIVQGASTITQQLVKLLYTDCSRTLSRKLKDQFLALLVEHQYTKEQIMQTYLNNICFGCGIYGIEAASQRFWGISVESLSIAQAATLAGIVKNPTNYCPLLYPLSCQKRRDLILKSMNQLNFIVSHEYQHALNVSIEIVPQREQQCAPHLKEAIRLFIEEHRGKHALYTGGFIIKTTLNSALQQQAEDAFVNHLKKLKKEIDEQLDGALLTIEVKTGRIKAMIGGFDFNTSQFNRAVQAKLPMASIFKPLIYAVAIDQGMTFADVALDEPLSIDVGNGTLWQPRNHSETFEGQMTLAKALSHSNNIIAIKTLLNLGYEQVISLAKKCGITSHIPSYPSIALGCIDVTLKEAIGMFNIFANNGIYVEPHMIEWIKDQWENKIYHSKPITEQVLASTTSGKVAKVLSLGCKRIKKRLGNQWIDSQALGKTGTTNDGRTTLFAGSTPELTTIIRLGRDDNKTLGLVFGLQTAFPIWKNFHMNIPTTTKHFSFDPGLKKIYVDGLTGRNSHKDSPGTLSILV